MSPAVPIGPPARLDRRLDRKDAGTSTAAAGPTRDFPDPAPVQVLALEANRFDPDVPWSVPLDRPRAPLLPVPPARGRPRRRRARSRARCGGSRPRTPSSARTRVRVRRLVDPPLRGPRAPGRSPVDALPPRRRTSAVLGRRCSDRVRVALRRVHRASGHFGIPTLLFGPRGAGSHNAGRVRRGRRPLLRTAEVYLAAALEWCGA